MVSPPS
ncbi:hypothetical protein ECEC4013_5757, partial [Escherichia coli EC4013]